MEQFDVVVIGSGPGGYIAAIRAAQLGLKTACIEKEKTLGGTCLNVGCIPSKTLLHTTESYWKMVHESTSLGITTSDVRIQFDTMMQNKQKVVTGFNEGISALFKKNKITQLIGAAQLTSPHTIAINDLRVEAKHIILATGSEPIALAFLPFDEKRVLSSTGALALSQVPKRLLVVGAGIIGVELGSVYSRLGAEVTFVEFLDRICPTLDTSLSSALHKSLTQQGMQFNLSTKVVSAQVADHEIILQVAAQEGSRELRADAVLVCIGRKPYTKGLGLENVGILTDAKGYIPINGRFQTSVPSIYAIGDVVDGPMLAHKASEEGVCVAEIIAGQNPTLEYMAIPSVVYTYPEVAAVGLTEKEIQDLKVEAKSGLFSFKANSRAKCTGEDEGFVKIFAHATTDKILGVHIIGAHASELIAGPTLAIQNQMTALELAHTPCAHPTLSEAIKEAALALHGKALHK